MHEFVCCGNVLSSRVALLIHLCHYLKLRWILEQPDGSFLPQMPRYQQLWRTFEVGVRKILTSSCSYLS